MKDESKKKNALRTPFGLKDNFLSNCRNGNVEVTSTALLYVRAYESFEPVFIKRKTMIKKNIFSGCTLKRALVAYLYFCYFCSLSPHSILTRTGDPVYVVAIPENCHLRHKKELNYTLRTEVSVP